MNYGVQLSTSGVLTSLYRQDVFTNNLANLDTVGFKPDIPEVRARDTARTEDGLFHLPTSTLLEKLGAGVSPGLQRTAFSQGRLGETSNPLDIGIEGEGFFVVRLATDGQADRLALTRDGRFTLNSTGRLVTASDGLPVLDASNRPIDLDTTSGVTIDDAGFVRQRGEIVTQLKLAEPPDKRSLRKLGQSLFEPDAATAQNLRPATGKIMQGWLEDSAVNEVREMMRMTDASRAVSTNIGMITYHDRLMEQAITRFGRIA
jgi:flagellar basal-body rod protein FlgG